MSRKVVSREPGAVQLCLQVNIPIIRASTREYASEASRAFLQPMLAGEWDCEPVAALLLRRRPLHYGGPPSQLCLYVDYP